MSDDLAPRLQRSLGDAFTLERELGGGGMARVWLANDRALDRRVVVKVLDLEGAVAASAERFRREIKLIAQLQHPHIVPVLTAGGDDTLLWYAMPYVAGESLRARLVREGALPLPDALRIARELLDALAFAHEHGVVHRDVKPENILLEGRHAVVADFGVAKALAEAGISGGGLTSVGLALGTPAYMAPEQAMADPTTNHRADLYAAGAVIYEMLAGFPPFSGNAQSVIAAHLTTPAPRIEERRNDVPPGIASLVTRLMAKNPAERPQSAHEVAVALEAVTTPGGSGVMAAATTPMPAPAPTSGTASSRSRKPMLIATAVIVVAASAGLYWRSRADAAPVVAGADLIAVMPLGTTDPALAQSAQDLVVLVSTALDGVGAIRATDPSSVLMQGAKLPRPIPLATALGLGRQFGAGSVLHGSLVREGTSMRAEVTLHRVTAGRTDDILARASVQAPLDSIRALADALVIALLGEVWARGTPPTPVLDSIATGSPVALRAFLEAEQHFARGDPGAAVPAFERAIRADSNFAQAYRRLSYVRGWYGWPADAAVNARLRQLIHRLPARDREIMAADDSGTYLESLERMRNVAAKYPDYPPAQWPVADAYIHSGSFYGLSIREALPYIERLEIIAPNHIDNATHRAMAGMATFDSANVAQGLRDMLERGRGSPWAQVLARTGQPFDPAADLKVVLDFAPETRRAGPVRWVPGMSGRFGLTAAEQIRLLELAEERRELTDLRPILRSAIAHYFATRGDFPEAVRRTAELERSDAPPAIKLASARIAAQGSWLGTVPVEDAERALRRWDDQQSTLTNYDRAELAWLDGLVAIVRGDSSGMERAATRALRVDTTLAYRQMPRSLRALWRERRQGAIDSLRAFVDGEISGGSIAPGVAIHRLALGRGLIRAGEPAAAERYLQWTDAMNLGLRGGSAIAVFRPITAYERGIAAQDAGDRFGAIAQFEYFLREVDRPGPALEAAVADAKARLTRLKSSDR